MLKVFRQNIKTSCLIYVMAVAQEVDQTILWFEDQCVEVSLGRYGALNCSWKLLTKQVGTQIVALQPVDERKCFEQSADLNDTIEKSI